jgi:hypothetical protein
LDLIYGFSYFLRFIIQRRTNPNIVRFKVHYLSSNIYGSTIYSAVRDSRFGNYI